MTKKEIFLHEERLHAHIMEAYEIAGGLRDVFTNIEGNEAALKDYCNEVRGLLYKIREMRGKFKFDIQGIEEI